MGETTTRRRLVVHGHVQGVSFRATCADVAQAAGVRGWVANEPDGTVAVELEGDHEAVDEVVAWCRTGPPGGRVDRVDEHEVEPLGARTFEVR